MAEQIKAALENLKNNPPWQLRSRTTTSTVWEGNGTPEPGEFKKWKNAIRSLNRKWKKAAEEEARQMINRP